MSLGVSVLREWRCLWGPGTEGLWAEQAQSGDCVHRKVCLELLGGSPEEAALLFNKQIYIFNKDGFIHSGIG